MSPAYIKIVIVSILGISFVVNLVTTLLSAGRSNRPLPEELEDVFENEEQHQTAVRYILTNVNFYIITSSLSLIAIILFIYFNGFAILDQYLSESRIYPLLQPLWFFGILYYASDIVNIPLQLYAQFGIEERFGFNKMTLKLFFIDKIKGWLVSGILGGIILFLLFWLLDLLKQDYWYIFWIVISVFMIAMNLLYTSVLVPLFNKLTPLEEGSLKDAILEYCESVDFPVDNIFVIDGSKRSSKANAFFSGFGKQKKIVLYDTLIEDLSTEEIVAVLAHEAGHYKQKHIIQSLAAGILQTGAILFISSLIIFNANLSQALGVDHLALHINLIVFGFLFSPISSILGVLMNLFSRKNEYEADAYAGSTYGVEPLISSLKKLSKNNFSNLTPHPVDVFLNYSHPTLLQRIRAMRDE